MADNLEARARQRAAHPHLEDVLAELLKKNGKHNGGATAA
jgi:hypothetical protein